MISNALSTSITGYQNRISIKNLETIIVDNLRKSAKGSNIIQTLYAECGLDSGRLEKVKFPTIMLSNNELEKSFKTNIKDVNKMFNNKTVAKMLDDEFNQIVEDREEFRRIHISMENSNPKEYIMENRKLVPVNIARVIDDIIFNYSEIHDDKKLYLNPIKCIERVNNLCEVLPYTFMNGNCLKNKNHIPLHIKESTYMMQILTRSYLSTKYLLTKGVNDNLLDIIINKILVIYKKALIDYGSSVGILAAQCVSEPMTQFILDSKHRTGGQGGTKTNEIVRIQEILGAKSTIKMRNPHTIAMVNEEHEDDKDKVQEIANCIEMLIFDRFISSEQIFYEEYGNPVHPEYEHEKKIISDIMKFNFGEKTPTDLTKWCIRFSINKEELILKSMKIETLILAIRKHIPNTVHIIYSPENYKDTFIRCYLRNTIDHKNNNNYYQDVVLTYMNKIKNVIVRGISGLISTTVIDVVKNKKKPDGGMERHVVHGISVVGTNMSKLLTDERIDNYRVQSDSIEEIERVFGIVAARDKIINELVSTLSSLNKFHCNVFADEMTYTGNVTSIQKTGLQIREKNNITLRLSFQTPVQVVQDAAINGMTDVIGGVSGPLIMGTNPNVGTTFNSCCINEEFIKASSKGIKSVIEDL